MAIYTRRGDRGTTSLYGQKGRVRKDDQKIVALGNIDELNCQIGWSLSFLSRESSGLANVLQDLQQDLLEIGAELASPRTKSPFTLVSGKTKKLEKIIDKLEGNLPVLGNFILPGGSQAGAAIHVARSVARRAERDIVRLAQSVRVNSEILRYLNRLSDCLFMLAREVNRLEKRPEKVWKGKIIRN